MRQTRSKRPQQDFTKINSRIRAPEVRLIDNDGNMSGVVSLKEALAEAEQQELDLVEISPNANPPVCKIIDYGRYLYQTERKRKEAKKNQKVVHLKEIKMRPKTDIHDYNFKIKHVKEFLANGDRVKITIRFKGREMAYIENGREQIQRVLNDVEGVAKPDAPPRIEGRNMSLTLIPETKKKKEKQPPADSTKE